MSDFFEDRPDDKKRYEELYNTKRKALVDAHGDEYISALHDDMLSELCRSIVVTERLEKNRDSLDPENRPSPVLFTMLECERRNVRELTKALMVSINSLKGDKSRIEVSIKQHIFDTLKNMDDEEVVNESAKEEKTEDNNESE